MNRKLALVLVLVGCAADLAACTAPYVAATQQPHANMTTQDGGGGGGGGGGY